MFLFYFNIIIMNIMKLVKFVTCRCADDRLTCVIRLPCHCLNISDQIITGSLAGGVFQRQTVTSPVAIILSVMLVITQGLRAQGSNHC